jgi:toxin ParE1/3/4
MSALLFSPAAHADIDDFWEYTVAEWGEAQALRYIGIIREACNDLVEGKRVGRTVNVRKGYLKIPVGSHILFYRMGAAGAVLVIRILHARMDVERHL